MTPTCPSGIGEELLDGNYDVTPSHRLRVQAEHANLRLDQFLAAAGVVSRTKARALLSAGAVYLDRHRTRVASKPVREGQVVEVYLIETPRVVDAPKIPVIYQDDAIIVVNKPVGMPVQAARETVEGCLVTVLARQLGLSSGILRVVHRLDEDTSGVVVLALTQASAAALSTQFSTHSARREYLAAGVGTAHPAETLRHFLTPIVAQPQGPARVMARLAEGDAQPDERLAISHCQVLAQSQEFSLLRVQLETGRTHQIRAQLSAAGLPLVGDTRYGAPPPPVLSPLQRVGLHALKLELRHPSDLSSTRAFFAPLPDDLQRWLELHSLWLPTLAPDTAGTIPLFQ